MQGYLGMDRKNPILTLQTSDDGKRLYVYLGFHYYTSIPNDRTSVQYRLLVGQLALAGFLIASLMRVFGFSRPTIMRYKEIVANTTDETELFAKLRGYHCEKTKLTPDVEAYIRVRFETVYSANRGSYNRQLRQEVRKQFGVELSPEALRRVIAPLRQQFDRQQKAAHQISCDGGRRQREPASRATTKGKESPFSGDGSPLVEPEPLQSSRFAESNSGVTGDPSVQDDGHKGKLHLHAGLLVLNFWLADFAAGFKSWRDIFLQWLYQIFAGAVNFEQGRYTARSELSRFIGQAAVGVSKSRLFLKKLAQESFAPCLKMLFEVNFKCMSKHKPCYFYVDGHFDPYYGLTEILKGWCCLFNRTIKGTHHYAIYDSQGYPMVKELKDCFDDFRAYLRQAIQRIKSFMLGVPFGIVFDRGGFSEAMFRYFDAEGVYFITWQKYFDIKKESGLEFNSSVTIERQMNQVGNFKAIVFDCAETIYRLGDAYECRKLVIRTERKDKNDQKSDFYAGILTNDPIISHQMIIELMTSRWRFQENDFKYQKKHFGLDQITPYDVSPVQSIQALIDEQKGYLKGLKKELADGRTRQQHLYQQLGVKRLTQKRTERIRKEAARNPQMYELMSALRALQPKLQELSLQIVQLEKKIKRLEKIEAKGYVHLDYRKKQIFDHLRFTARNIFYNAIAEFREHYPNLRDLHVVFWSLVRASGFIKYNKEQITVRLFCPFFEGKVYEAVQSFLEKLNEKEPVLLDGSNRKIVFRINP